MRVVIAIGLALVAGAASAQHLYRCGSTFSQTPCGPDAKQVSAAVPQPSGPVDPEVRVKIEDDCRRWIVGVPQWKDRESVRIGTIYRGANQPRDGRVLRAYHVSVNAKNSYGGYQGERPFVCYADEASAKVLDLYQPGDLRP